MVKHCWLFVSPRLHRESKEHIIRESRDCVHNLINRIMAKVNCLIIIKQRLAWEYIELGKLECQRLFLAWIYARHDPLLFLHREGLAKDLFCPCNLRHGMVKAQVAIIHANVPSCSKEENVPRCCNSRITFLLHGALKLFDSRAVALLHYGHADMTWRVL